jgi:hypothetical protein
MSIQPQQTTDISIPLQALHRSTTVLSLEERTIDRAAQVTAPHHEDFYQYDWFENLIIFIFSQALVLSLFVLVGAYGAYDSGTLLAPSQNPVQLFQYILTWMTLYAPGNTMTYAAYHLFSRTSAHWKWRTRLSRWYNSKFPRPHTLKHTQYIRMYNALPLMALFISGFDLLFRAPVPAFWEDLFPYGQYLTFYVVGFILLIGVPWWIVLRKKLRRQVRRSS